MRKRLLVTAELPVRQRTLSRASRSSCSVSELPVQQRTSDDGGLKIIGFSEQLSVGRARLASRGRLGDWIATDWGGTRQQAEMCASGA